jgi:hypothetical protein
MKFHTQLKNVKPRFKISFLCMTPPKYAGTKLHARLITYISEKSNSDLLQIYSGCMGVNVMITSFGDFDQFFR